MRKLLLGGIYLLLAASIMATDYEVYPQDSLILEKVNLGSPGTVAVTIEFVNSQNLAAFQIPIALRGEGAQIDSLSFYNSRIDYIGMRPVSIIEDGQKLLFGAICMMEEHIAPGRGLMATIYLTVNDSLMDHSIYLDSTTVGPASILFTKSNSSCYMPVFEAGQISNPKATIEPLDNIK